MSAVATTATTQGEAGKVSECGYAPTCSAFNPNGLQLSLSINTTSVIANGSLSFIVSLANPSTHQVNESSSTTWYLSDLPSSWPCYDGSVPYAFAVFRGHYTLLNVSSAENILRPDVYLVCLSLPKNATMTSIPAMSTFTPSQSFQIYAVEGGTVRVGNQSVGVYSLWSDKPSEYTMVAGDEWGDFVLLNFLVVP